MLTHLDRDILTWRCLNYDEYGDLSSCGQEKQAHIEDTHFHVADPARGPVIALPRCTCGNQMFLKADYTLKECWQVTLPVVNAAGQTWAFVMRPGHARNIIAHWWHYVQGTAPTAPILPLLPQAKLTAKKGAERDTLLALWFGWLAYQEVGQYQPGIPILSPLPQLLALPEPERIVERYPI